MTKKIIKGTLLSILIFFSISFLTILPQLNSPINRVEEMIELEIGFPWIYYYQFTVDCPNIQSGWKGGHLLLDAGLTWIITIMLIVVFEKITENRTS